MARRGREASARIGRNVRATFAHLLDQRTPFGRLALVHVLATAGDTLVTVSLAGSLFFSISPEAAKDRVILYLLLTMAPFAVVAPLLGPVIDRSRGARRATVAFSTAGRAAVCLVMAGGLHSLLLFPEAFTMLVLSKVYLVTKGALVPLLVADRAEEEPGRTPPPPPPSPSSPPLAVPPAPPAAYGLPGPAVGPGPPTGPGAEDSETSVDHNRLATANAQLGLLASLTAFAASLPAIAILKLFGGGWVLRLDILVFAAATVFALRLPIRNERRRVEGSARRQQTTSSSTADWESPGPRAALGPTANTHPEVTLALSAMSILKGIAGFLVFMLAFDLRREHATIWYGPTLGLSIAGAVVGVLLVPRARRVFSEQQVLALAIWLVAISAAATAVIGGVPIQVVLAFVVGLAGGAGKPAFDALAQRYIPTAAQGRAFARFETRFQLIWVLGALLPVVASTPLVAGDIVIAAVAGVGAFSYMTGRRAVRHLRPGTKG